MATERNTAILITARHGNWFVAILFPLKLSLRIDNLHIHNH
jgi:hypothetical protein